MNNELVAEKNLLNHPSSFNNLDQEIIDRVRLLVDEGKVDSSIFEPKDEKTLRGEVSQRDFFYYVEMFVENNISSKSKMSLSDYTAFYNGFYQAGVFETLDEFERIKHYCSGAKESMLLTTFNWIKDKCETRYNHTANTFLNGEVDLILKLKDQKKPPSTILEAIQYEAGLFSRAIRMSDIHNEIKYEIIYSEKESYAAKIVFNFGESNDFEDED